MINKLKILAPYFDVSGFKKGDEFAPDGKSVLVTGDNHTGKSTFFHMLYETARIHRNYKEGNPLNFASPFWALHSGKLSETHKNADDYFDYAYREVESILLDGNSLIPSSYTESYSEQFPERDPEGKHFEKFQLNEVKKDLKNFTLEVYSQFFPLPSQENNGNNYSLSEPLDSNFLFELAVSNPDLFKKVPQLSKKAFLTAQEKFYGLLNHSDSNQFHTGSVEVYNHLIENLASDFKVSANYLRGLCMMADTHQLGSISDLGTEYLFMKPDKVPSVIGAHYNIPGKEKQYRSVILNKDGSEDYFKSESASAGEGQKKTIDTLLNSSANVLIIDEPLTNMDMKSQKEYAQKLMQTDKQIFVSSHNFGLTDKLQDAGWYHIGL